MSMHELRAEVRIPVTQRGNLSAGGEWFPCLVLDMSSSGFLLVSNKALAVGQTLDFRCELHARKRLECLIEVMHSNNDSAGTMITEIDDKATAMLRAYLDEKYAVALDNLPKARPK